MSESAGVWVRSSTWCGVHEGDEVVVDLDRERRRRWRFVAHVRDERNGEEWIEVRGGRNGEATTRSFRVEVIYPGHARAQGTSRTRPLVEAPMLPFGGFSALRRSR